MEKSLKSYVRDIPDFPKKGIIFKDITPLIGDPEAFRSAINEFYERYKNKKIEYIVSVESRGFIFGAALAYLLKCGLVPVRKKGKLPYSTHEVTYALEYGSDTLQMHEDAFQKGARVLLIDDLLATGGTTNAAMELIEKIGGKIIEAAFVIELEFLKGKDKIKNVPIFSLIKY